MRQRVIDLVGERATTWFTRIATDLDTALRQVADDTLTSVRADLTAARLTAQDVLGLTLTPVDTPAPVELPRLPVLDPAAEVAWRELLTYRVASSILVTTLTKPNKGRAVLTVGLQFLAVLAAATLGVTAGILLLTAT